ncbi:MAG: ABC transporter ATP-binding protein [Sphingobacteriaceae bacterium]|nr:ABC transporter ATP-binding protein [Sphingobacteriaceae bacterium]
MSDPIVEVRQLTKAYGKFQALHEVNFEVHRGDVFGFLGPNGAGKSTTIRILLSLISADSGTLSLFGMPLATHRREILQKIGCIVEKPDFYKYLSARRNLEIFGRVSGADTSKRNIDAMLAFVGLEGRANDKLGGFSHGMRQRLGLAQALLHQPELIVLDEPTTGLDPQGIIDIRELILQLSREQGKTIILSSHLLSEIELIANRMVIINKGRSLAEGSVKELLNAEELVVTFELNDGAAAVALLQQRPEVVLREQHDNRLTLQINREEVPELNQWLQSQGLRVYAIESKRKLEDYFLKLVNN